MINLSNDEKEKIKEIIPNFFDLEEEERNKLLEKVYRRQLTNSWGWNEEEYEKLSKVKK